MKRIVNWHLYLFLLYFILPFSVLGSALFSLEEKPEQNPDSCTNDEFRCGNGRCIAQPFVCDGTRDCEDGSDETNYQCRNITCDEEFFQCDYGACINKKFQCDGQEACSDGSDEKECEDRSVKKGEECDKKNSCAVPSLPPNETSCAVPPISPNRAISYTCPSKCDPNDGFVPNGTIADIECASTYFITSNESRKSVCVEGVWQTTLLICTFVPYSPYVYHGFIDRVSTLGEFYSGAPWHVAIYNGYSVLICGGTIIHPYLVLSAAHCFDKNDTIDENLLNYEVVVSKVSKLHSKTDNSYQKVHKIREIRTSKKGYYGLPDQFTADVVALILKEKIEMNDRISPACVNWSDWSQRIDPDDGALGRVSGWGLMEISSNLYSEYLMATNLPFISRKNCVKTVPSGFREYITFDKFCAGTDDGPAVLQGDSGGGFLLPQFGPQNQTTYCLRGLVSLKETSLTHIAAFTDLADHYEWIRATYDEAESRMTSESRAFGEQICNNYNSSNCIKVKECAIADTIIQTQKPIYCGYDSDNADTERICCDLQNTSIIQEPSKHSKRVKQINDEKHLSAGSVEEIAYDEKHLSAGSAEEIAYDEKHLSAGSAEEIASSYCDEYSKYATDCVSDAPPLRRRTPALLKEYPHVAHVECNGGLLGYNSCVGSLISKWFVMSAVCCEFLGGPAMKVRLGSLSLKNKEDQAQTYAIERTYMHPNYSFPQHSIVLHKLKTSVVFNSYIRPACLSTRQFVGINSKLRTASWGSNRFPNGGTETLQKGIVTVLDDEICKINLASFDAKSQTCAGDKMDGEALCLIFEGGSPLMSPVGNTSCMWSIYAMWFSGVKFPKSCQKPENMQPFFYMKVAPYLEWIQGIVWPTSSSPQTPSSRQNTEEVHVPVRTQLNKNASGIKISISIDMT